MPPASEPVQQTTRPAARQVEVVDTVSMRYNPPNISTSWKAGLLYSVPCTRSTGQDLAGTPHVFVDRHVHKAACSYSATQRKNTGFFLRLPTHATMTPTPLSRQVGPTVTNANAVNHQLSKATTPTRLVCRKPILRRHPAPHRQALRTCMRRLPAAQVLTD